MRLAAIDWKRLAWRAAGPAIILAAAALASAPLKIDSYSCGHDFDFHLLSWFEAANSWRHGLFYPHWTASANYGAGEPRFIFYPPLTWMLGAALRRLMTWGLVPAAITFLMLAGTGLATRALALELLADAPATLAGCIALFSGYSLFNAYERSAYGEMMGGLLVPLLLLFALRQRRPNGTGMHRALDGSLAPLAVVVACLWLSDVPIGIMGCYLLAAVALGAALLRRSLAPVLRAAGGAILGLGLASIYLVPATWEQRWVDVAQATTLDPGSRVEANWLFARHSDPAMDLHDAVLLKVSIIASSMLALALLALVLAWRRGRLKERRNEWILLALIPAVILLLQFPISLPVWKLVPELRMLQFPWRWILAIEAPMGIFLAAAFWPVKRWRQTCLCVLFALLFAGAIWFANKSFRQNCDADDSISGMLTTYRSGTGFEGYNEYAPPDADNSLVAAGLPGACLVADPNQTLGAPSEDIDNPVWDPSQHSCEATFAATWPAREHFHVSAGIQNSGYLVLRLRKYPAWRVTMNGKPVSSLGSRDDGLMVIPVPRGLATVDATWKTTGDAIAGRWLSGIALAFVTAFWLLERRLRLQIQPHLS
jgi:hypothetical protein